VRIAVVGAGVAGALLAHRLTAAGATVTVHAGPGPDATAVSGGLTRAFEPDPVTCRLAAESLAELLADPALAAAAGFRETGSVYLLPSADDLDLPLKELADRLPGAARVVPPGPEWHGLPATAVAVVEDRAGHLAPDRLRAWALAGADVVPAAPDPTALTGYDAVVLATGRWTPGLLTAAGLPNPYRTKAIQYGLHPCGDWTPPAFVDGTSGLWGRPAGPGSVLLGVPSDRWDPAAPVVDPALVARSTALARERFGVPVGPPTAVVASADAYADPPVLALRPVGGRPGLFTFTGGSGGAAKYALAASRAAAADLLG
jgi:glycine/D-amino acid oxidase-like deaminating enzyme